MRLCVSQGKFHEALETVLGRSVDSYEYGRYYDSLVAEFLRGQEPPTVDEILDMIPYEYRSVISTSHRLQEVA
jgi:hypothetical protein